MPSVKYFNKAATQLRHSEVETRPLARSTLKWHDDRISATVVPVEQASLHVDQPSDTESVKRPPRSTPMTYVFLTLAIIFEVAWAIGIKLNSNFAPPIKWGSLIATLVAYLLSLGFLMLTVRKMNIGTAYAVWAGTGAAIISIIGIIHFHEPRSTLKIASLALVVAGLVGLNLSESQAKEQTTATHSD